MFSGDEAAIRALIPRFTAVVVDMIKRGLVEIREPADMVWDHAPPMSDADIHDALTDPATWIWGADGDNRMVMLMTTDHTDALLGRRPGT